MKQPGSNFVSWTGLGVLAVLVLVAAYFDMAVFESFLVMLLLLCLAAFVWGRLSLRGVEVECGDGDRCGFPGQVLELPAGVNNRKLLPLLWLELSVPLGENACVAPEMLPPDGEDRPEQALHTSFLWLMPRQSLRWRQRAVAVRRGVLRVEQVTLRSGDGFGLSVQTSTVRMPCAGRYVVYPRIVPVDVAPILHNMREMESARNGFYTDRTLLENTRPYREGDSFKHINWRQLARRDELQVNIYEKLTMRRVCFVPDLFSFTHLEEMETSGGKKTIRVVERESMEEMFSLMASLIVKLHEREVRCALVVPSVGEQPARIVIPEHGGTQIAELLGALAEVEYAGEKTALPLGTVARERHKLGQIYVMSRSVSRSMLSADEGAAEEMGAITVVQERPGPGAGGRGIFTETDFRRA